MGNINYLLYCTDANYWMQLYVSLYSLLKNNTERKFEVFIISNYMDNNFFKNLSFLKKFNNLTEVKLVSPDISNLKNAPVSRYTTLAAYYRLLIGSLLPDNVKRILYLDCDTIIDSSLSELFETDIDDHILSACRDCNSTNNSIRLGLPRDVYFNSGVLFINLENWRSLNVEDSLFNYIKNNSKDIVFHDQDILNAVLYNKWVGLNLKFNFQEFNHRISQSFEKIFPDIKPSVLHFLGNPKPWLYMSTHFHKKKFWKYLRETPYRNYREPDNNFANRIRKTLLFRKLVQKNPALHKFLKTVKNRFIRFISLGHLPC